MRHPLQKFTSFSNTLFPHETAYLLSIQNFKDQERLAILERVNYNAQQIDQFTPFDTQIDKRKYSHLQKWIEDRLAGVDVDIQLSNILTLKQKVMMDTIRMEEEKELLKQVRNYQSPTFYFTKFYDLVEQYRQFLLIRLRYADHQLLDEFIQKYRDTYNYNQQVKEKLHAATKDIVGHYSGKLSSSKQWEEWLSAMFYDERVEGHMHYMALVRLTFIGHNYRQYDMLREKFDYLDQQFSKGKYYSKRHLGNYYNSRLMLHSNFGEYQKAVYYGYLSIRAKTHDHLLYVNNLCAVLLRCQLTQEALQLMQQNSSVAKKTKNFHNRVGFVAFYMEALNKNGMYLNAERYGDSFLKAYEKEVLQFRWHLFFSVYLEAMLSQRRYEKILKIAKRFRLSERDKAYQSNANYLPKIPVYVNMARFQEGLIRRQELDQKIKAWTEMFEEQPQRQEAFQKLLQICGL